MLLGFYLLVDIVLDKYVNSLSITPCLVHEIINNLERKFPITKITRVSDDLVIDIDRPRSQSWI